MPSVGPFGAKEGDYMTRSDQIAAHTETHDFAAEMEGATSEDETETTPMVTTSLGLRSHCWTGFESVPSSSTSVPVQADRRRGRPVSHRGGQAQDPSAAALNGLSRTTTRWPENGKGTSYSPATPSPYRHLVGAC